MGDLWYAECENCGHKIRFDHSNLVKVMKTIGFKWSTITPYLSCLWFIDKNASCCKKPNYKYIYDETKKE